MTAIAKIETILVRLPTRRTHSWTGLTEPIGQYLLVKMTGTDGTVGWGEAPALKDWGGEFGRYYGESVAIVDLIIERYLAPGNRRSRLRPTGGPAPQDGRGGQGLSLCQGGDRLRLSTT